MAEMEDARKNFETSGKVTDYLFYRNTVKESGTKGFSGEEETEKRMDRYGAEYRFDGDDFKCNAHWGV
ncbi:MAG: hypothetical protein OSJ44_16005 [Lachnospiraceae bacterium]|nr:hypothetical protein [Lachnospiraceae bacterium]